MTAGALVALASAKGIAGEWMIKRGKMERCN
jgi:hypothetical protein